MKVLNEKGKLFGLINVVDLFVLLAVIAAAGAVGYKFLAKPAAQILSNKSEMVVLMRVRGSMPYFTEEILKIPAGEKLVAGNDYVDAEVLDISAVPYEVMNTTADGGIVSAIDPERSDVLITVKATAVPGSAVLKIGNQEVRAGRTFIFKTSTVEITAVIETVTFNG